jgi:hypothetical protein
MTSAYEVTIGYWNVVGYYALKGSVVPFTGKLLV